MRTHKRLIDIPRSDAEDRRFADAPDLPAGVDIEIKLSVRSAETANKNQVGILGTKLGMTQLWDENNKVVPVTVIQAVPVVTQVRTPSGRLQRRPARLRTPSRPRRSKPDAGHFAKADVTPQASRRTACTADASEFTLGQELTAEAFAAARPST